MIDLETLTPRTTPNRYYVAPEGWGTALPDRTSPVFPWEGAELARRLRDVISEAPRTRILDETEDGLRFDAEQRTLLGFPDKVSIQVIELGDGGSTLAAYSRSRYGRRDFGVNRARVEGWLEALDSA